MTNIDFSAIDSLVIQAIDTGLFPGAAMAIGTEAGTAFRQCWGRRCFVPWSEKIGPGSLFDLASLTKPLVTAVSCMLLVQHGELSPEDRVSRFFTQAEGRIREITVGQLLSHSSGLRAHARFHELLTIPEHFTREKRLDLVCGHILSMPLACEPGTRAIYSDLGYILLGRIVQEITGQHLFEFAGSEILDKAAFPGICWKGGRDLEQDATVPSGFCSVRKRMLLGEVNDVNAWLLKGYAGHAGLFGSIEGVERMVSAIMRSCTGEKGRLPIDTRVIRRFWQSRPMVPGSTWHLGMDSPSASGSTAGRYFSMNSIGHLGYTGTSFWIDMDAGLYCVFLCNRTFPFDTAESRSRMKKFRILIHECARKSIGSN